MATAILLMPSLNTAPIMAATVLNSKRAVEMDCFRRCADSSACARCSAKNRPAGRQTNWIAASRPTTLRFREMHLRAIKELGMAPERTSKHRIWIQLPPGKSKLCRASGPWPPRPAHKNHRATSRRWRSRVPSPARSRRLRNAAAPWARAERHGIAPGSPSRCGLPWASRRRPTDGPETPVPPRISSPG